MRVEEECVDREIPASGVGRGIAEPHHVRAARIGIGTVGAECRDFHRNPVVRHQHYAECDTHLDRAWKKFSHPLRRGIGRDVVVGRV
jgi:hypothetical protein